MAIQRQRRDVATRRRELAATSRAGQPDAVNMSLELEIVVIDPHRVIEVELTVSELQVKFGHCADTQRHRVAESLKAVTARHCRRVQLHHTAHVHRLRRSLYIKEKCIESAESLHIRP